MRAGSNPEGGRTRRPRWPRRQPPAYSPIATRALLDATKTVMRGRPDPRLALEAHLRDAYDAEDVALCGSGTQALQLALRVARERAGDGPVALPAFTCFDVATAAMATEHRIMLYDVEPDTLAPDMDGVRHALRGGARILVIAPLFGLSPDWDALSGCAVEHGAVLVEDAAQGHGARWRGRVLGSLAPLSVLSFARGKGWTGGAGGALLLRDGFSPAPAVEPAPGTAEMKVLIGAAAQRCLSSPAMYALPAALPWLGLGETHYRSPVAPVRMTRAAAALLAGSRSASEEEAAGRRRTGAWWQRGIARRNGVRTVRVNPEATPGYLRFPLLLEGGLAALPSAGSAARMGVAPVYPAPLSALPEVISNLVDKGGAWPGAEELARDLVTLPTHSRLTATERAGLLDLLNTTPV